MAFWQILKRSFFYIYIHILLQSLCAEPSISSSVPRTELTSKSASLYSVMLTEGEPVKRYSRDVVNVFRTTKVRATGFTLSAFT